VKRQAPAADRNKAPIAEVLERVLPERGTVLEIASGTGQHAVFFARRFPRLVWQPSDLGDENVASIRAWIAQEKLENVCEPLALDVTRDEWAVSAADAVICINMVHIAPWRACLGLLDGAARLLRSGAPLLLYGPYKFAGEHTAPSNVAFDTRLRSEDPEWGVRDADEIVREAERRGIAFQEKVAMPANNFTLVFRRSTLGR
jgi:SAM-dependent methyltransferase